MRASATRMYLCTYEYVRLQGDLLERNVQQLIRVRILIPTHASHKYVVDIVHTGRKSYAAIGGQKMWVFN